MIINLNNVMDLNGLKNLSGKLKIKIKVIGTKWKTINVLKTKDESLSKSYTVSTEEYLKNAIKDLNLLGFSIIYGTPGETQEQTKKQEPIKVQKHKSKVDELRKSIMHNTHENEQEKKHIPTYGQITEEVKEKRRVPGRPLGSKNKPHTTPITVNDRKIHVEVSNFKIDPEKAETNQNNIIGVDASHDKSSHTCITVGQFDNMSNDHYANYTPSGIEIESSQKIKESKPDDKLSTDSIVLKNGRKAHVINRYSNYIGETDHPKATHIEYWDHYFMAMAELTALRSKDINTKVGAVIVSKDNKIRSIGYNGFPTGIDESKLPKGREGKPEDTKYPYVVHAEANAIMNGNNDYDGCTAYVTLFPCNECAKLICQSGIKKIIYLSDKYNNTPMNTVAKKLFDMMGIEYVPIDQEYQGLKELVGGLL